MKRKIRIEVDDIRWHKKEKLLTVASKVVGYLVACYDVEHKHICVLLTGSSYMQELNHTYRGYDKSTDVLSFPVMDVMSVYTLGDIAINYDDVCSQSHSSPDLQASSLAHLVIHGFLHLLGYDHIKDDEAVVMEDEEKRHLSALGYKVSTG